MADRHYNRGQNKPSEDLVEDTRQQFETSTQSVVDTQLAFDKAEEYEKRLADQDGSRNKRRLNSSSSQSNSQSHALVKAQPIGDIAAEIPGFELLSLVRWNETRQDGYDSEDSQDGDDETLARYDDLKRQAPAIVRRLCDGWTGLDQENLQGHGRILEHPSAGDEADDSNLESNLGNASEAEASRPPKLRGLSLYDANQDEAPARFSSYSNGASRRENEGPNPMSKSAQNSPRLRKEGNESRWDPFSSFLPERSEYTSSGKTPRPGISLGPRSDRAKGRAFGDSITSDQKQDFSRRSKKNTTRGSGDEFGLQAQSEMLDSLDESDFSKIYAREHMPPRRSARRRSPNSRIKKDLDLLNDQVDNVNWDCLTFPTMDSGPPVREPQVPFHWFNPTMQSGSAGAKWEVVTQQRPVAAVPPQHSDSDRCCRLYLWPHHYGSNFSRYGEIVLHLDQFSISSGDLTLGDLHDKVFRLVPGSFVSTKLLSIQGGAQLPYSSEAANKAGLMNGSILLCLASAHNSPATEGAITLVWNSMVLKAKELQSKGEPYQYSASARLIPMIPKVWN